MTRFHKPQPNKGKKLSLSASAGIETIDYSREMPTFCLRYVDPEYCITQCTVEERAAFADKIRRMSQLTWNQLIQAPRHGMGLEKIANEAIRPTKPTHISEDVTFIAFRFSGKKAMIGYRQDGLFHIIWFDRNFNVYSHG